jgi:hypothetical protein
MHKHTDRLPEGLEEVATRLRDERFQASPLELDRIKLAARTRAARPERRGGILRTRSITALVAMLFMVGGTGSVVAGGGGGSWGHDNAAKGQYKPPCKDDHGKGKGKGKGGQGNGGKHCDDSDDGHGGGHGGGGHGGGGGDSDGGHGGGGGYGGGHGKGSWKP